MMEQQANTPSVPLTLPTQPPHIGVEMFSQPRYLSGARDLVAAVARRFGFDEGACGQIALAVDEALCNIIRHGYDRRADGKIWIKVWPLLASGAPAAAESAGQASAAACGPGERCCGAIAGVAPADQDFEPMGILIAIEDEARQVDPALIKSRDLEDIRPGGLGVFIIQSVMDAVAYQHRDTGGMRLMMAKRIDPEATRRERLEHPDLEIADGAADADSQAGRPGTSSPEERQ
jgi:anti-sigma regulatory factor (Ser/Thr protein kinase)